MIELDSALIIVMIEVLALSLVLALLSLIFLAKRRAKEHAAANDLITRLEQAENDRNDELAKLIRANCVIDNDKLREILQEIRSSEHDLYHQILQIFLKRDVAILQEIDLFINNLAAAYSRVWQDSSLKPESGEDGTALEDAKAQIIRLKKEGSLLSEQLQMAMKTMDEISTEYTRVFNGKQTERELENSSKNMLNIFREAEQSICSSLKEVEGAKKQL